MRWLPVVGFEGSYEVSDHGDVRSITRVDSAGRTRYGREIRPAIKRFGYRRVRLCRDGVMVAKYVARIVLEAFVGPCPPGMEHSCHNDGNPANNHVANLRWDSREGNMADKVRHGTHTRGARTWSAKLTDEAVRDIRRRAAAGEPHKSLMAAYGVSRATIDGAANRRRWLNVEDSA